MAAVPTYQPALPTASQHEVGCTTGGMVLLPMTLSTSKHHTIKQIM